jgi:HAD superfamily hydrolase (TIGR01459 family)
LLTNAPRPSQSVILQIEKLGITKHYFDEIITSGDAAQLELFSGKFGNGIFHIGAKRDLSFFDISRDLLSSPINVNLVDISRASSIVCTGLFNDLTEEPSEYDQIISEGISRQLPLLCANPDIQVDFGNQRLWCAGAIAARYEKAGGTSLYFGKPHKPIYDLALKKLHKINPTVSKSEIICIGDGILTDIRGGISFSLDTLFVSGGLSDQDTGTINGAESPSKQKLTKFLQKMKIPPTATIGYLR